MTSKKNQATIKKKSNNKLTDDVSKHILLRDLQTDLLLIIRESDIASNQTSKIVIGKEVSYVGSDRVRGRGTILVIGSEKECSELMHLLEKRKSSDKATNSSSANEKALNLSDDSDHDHAEGQEEDGDHSNEDEEETTNMNKSKKTSQSNTNDKKRKSVHSKVSAQTNEQRGPLIEIKLNESNENESPNKRAKYDDNDNQYLHGRIMALREENKNLKKEIEDMRTKWMPRPEATTLKYFSLIVSLCSGEQAASEDKDEKMNSIKTILALSDEELVECTDSKSIRSTCRNIVRLVFKQQFDDPTVSFGQLLKDKTYAKVIDAIREYGKIKHPHEAEQFSKGELNNAMGSDFYQRDHHIKLTSTESSQDSAENSN